MVVIFGESTLQKTNICVMIVYEYTLEAVLTMFITVAIHGCRLYTGISVRHDHGNHVTECDSEIHKLVNELSHPIKGAY